MIERLGVSGSLFPSPPPPFFFSLSFCYVLSDSPLRALVHTLCLYGLRKGDDGGGQPGGGDRRGDTKVAWVVFEIALLVFFFFFIHSIPVARRISAEAYLLENSNAQ